MDTALRDHFANQARACDEYGSPFTARLIAAMGRDLEEGGPVAALVGGWPRSPQADAVALRLAGALHMAALSGRDPALAAEYPEQRAQWDADAVWRAARACLDRERDWVAEFIRSAPQTNETRRSIALLPGFLTLAAQFDLPFDLLEIGASSGLNQCWDRFAYRTASWTWGPDSAVAVDTDWRGPPPPLGARPTVRSRAACDLSPLDLRSGEDRLRLRAYVWADQSDRLARFDAAVSIALDHGVQVARADAGAWLEARLARRAPDALTVVYHSVFYQYPPRETRQRIAAAIEQAGRGSRVPLAWLRVEPEPVLGGPRDSRRYLIDLITWPDGVRRTLGVTDGHARFVDTRAPLDPGTG